MGNPQLGQAGSVVLATVAGVVTGTVPVGPAVDSRDPHTVWNVDQIIWKTTAASGSATAPGAPGVAPIPRLEVYLDDPSNFGNVQIVDYDGSFGTASGSCRLVRGQTLRAIWTGGTAGTIAQFAVTGTKGKG